MDFYNELSFVGTAKQTAKTRQEARQKDEVNKDTTAYHSIFHCKCLCLFSTLIKFVPSVPLFVR